MLMHALEWRGRADLGRSSVQPLQQHTERMTNDHNKRLVHRLVEIVNEGDLDSIEEVATGQIASEANRWLAPFRESFPDFHMEVVDVIAEDDKAVGYFKCSGTHQGEWRGHAATGRRFEAVDEVYIFRVEDGKLASALAVVEDNLTRLRTRRGRRGNIDRGSPALIIGTGGK